MASAGEKPTLLIVDDEQSFTESLQLAIEDDFTVVTANSLRTARQVLAAVSPQAVLLDLRLPDGTGLDLLPDLKDRERPPVVVVMTAYGTVETFFAALREGAVDYLAKPLNIGRLKTDLKNRLETMKRSD